MPMDHSGSTPVAMGRLWFEPFGAHSCLPLSQGCFAVSTPMGCHLMPGLSIYLVRKAVVVG